MLLSFASTKVMVNGIKGNKICHAQGLRQGDPLSQMLFLMVMECLNLLMQHADEGPYFNHWVSGPSLIGHHFYADNVVLCSCH